MKVSIIIPVKQINDYIRETIGYLKKLDYSNFEVIIITDEKEYFQADGVDIRILNSGKVGPAEKRDIGAKFAKGEILAFLDDDAYPRTDWLNKALPKFENKKVGAVGGPAITPPDDDLMQKVSGAVFESFTGGGMTRKRYIPAGKEKIVEDWPTVNLLVRKKVFDEIGGFDCAYWPGEDTKFCLDLINKDYQIIYTPDAIVYHHRRSDILKHFKQIGNYGIHRGYFAKIYPKTSLKFSYFIPSFLVIYLLFLVGWVFLNGFDKNFFIFWPLGVYLALLLIDGLYISLRHQEVMAGVLVMPMIAATHIWYGIRFIWGLILPKMDK